MSEVPVRLVALLLAVLVGPGLVYLGIRAIREDRRRERDAATFHGQAGTIVRFSDLIPHREPPPGFAYCCDFCGKGLTEDEMERHLIADWPHCEECWQELCDSLDATNRKGQG